MYSSLVKVKKSCSQINLTLPKHEKTIKFLDFDDLPDLGKEAPIKLHVTGRRMFVLQQPRVEHGARVRFPSADGLDHVDAVAARAKGDRKEDTPAVQRERVRDGATERMLSERSEQVVGEGVGHGCVGLPFCP